MNISSDRHVHFDTDTLPERDCPSAVHEQFDGQLETKLRPRT
jgi:hypothetical protein